MALDYGIKVSKPGFDVKTCADKDLIMSSKLNTTKVCAIGLTSSTYTHSLGYSPVFFACSQISATRFGIVGQAYFAGLPYSTTTLFDANGGTTRYYLLYHGAI